MRLITTLMVALILAVPASAGTVGVEFDHTATPATDGYRLYWGPNPDPVSWDRVNDVLELGGQEICVDPESDGTYLCTPFGGGQSPDVIPNLPRVWFVVTAYNAVGESADSNTVSKDYVVPGEPNNLRFTP